MFNEKRLAAWFGPGRFGSKEQITGHEYFNVATSNWTFEIYWPLLSNVLECCNLLISMTDIDLFGMTSLYKDLIYKWLLDQQQHN